MSEHDERLKERIDAAWRSFANRPARLSPSEAARRVVDRLPAEPMRVSLRVWALAAAAVLICVSAWVALRPQPAPLREALSVPPPLPENVVQWWLDDETPVYFVLSPRDSKGGS
jgi:ferric-dicitrate binding protein FerR (iron transport regulator)